MTPKDKYPLGGFAWLDKNASLRRWFANWFMQHWQHVYSESVRQLHSKEDWERFDKMEKEMKRIGAKSPVLSTTKHISVADAIARKLQFYTTNERIERELRWFLTNAGQQSKHAPAFKASPWCNHFANKKRTLEEAGAKLPYRLYPRNPDARLALEQVISEFGSFEILREVSPELSRLLAVQRSFAAFEKAIKALPAGMPTLTAFQKTEQELHKVAATLQTEISLKANEPAAFSTPLRVRRLQRALYYAVRRLSKPKDGVDKLAIFLLKIIKQWPQIPAGMEFDLENHFNLDMRSEMIRSHLGLTGGQSGKAASALYRIFHAVVFRYELRDPLLHLAREARLRAEQRRKGWEHLRLALKAVFNHVRRETSDEAKFRNFERSNYTHMRNLTRLQRMRLLPELGNDPDHSVRDLTKAERMILAARYLKKMRTGLELDVNSKNSFATRYGRAMREVKRELG